VGELKPCPFCGSGAEIVTKDVEPQGDSWYGKRIETLYKLLVSVGFLSLIIWSGLLIQYIVENGLSDTVQSVLKGVGVALLACLIVGMLGSAANDDTFHGE
jgi:hypothetical protein